MPRLFQSLDERIPRDILHTGGWKGGGRFKVYQYIISIPHVQNKHSSSNFTCVVNYFTFLLVMYIFPWLHLPLLSCFPELPLIFMLRLSIRAHIFNSMGSGRARFLWRRKIIYPQHTLPQTNNSPLKNGCERRSFPDHQWRGVPWVVYNPVTWWNGGLTML